MSIERLSRLYLGIIFMHTHTSEQIQTCPSNHACDFNTSKAGEIFSRGPECLNMLPSYLICQPRCIHQFSVHA